MSRLTITLDDSLHQALKEAAARQGRSIGKIVEEGLLLRGIKPMEGARQLVARARQHAGCGDDEALRLAVEETRATRKK
jgi:plasmid stability protein